MRISDWSSDVCSSDLGEAMQVAVQSKLQVNTQPCPLVVDLDGTLIKGDLLVECLISAFNDRPRTILSSFLRTGWNKAALKAELAHSRSEEHTYELQSVMRISYAVFCFKKNKTH